jgi:hypothetical protein
MAVRTRTRGLLTDGGGPRGVRRRCPLLYKLPTSFLVIITSDLHLFHT